MTARGVLRSVTPPILLHATRWVRATATGSRRNLPVWEHVPEGWSRCESDPNIKSWDVPAIRDWHLARCLEEHYDLVFASNSLQYSEDWRELLRKLAAAARDYLYVAQLPTVARTPSFVAVQRPYAHGYDTEKLGWILNRDAALEAVSTLDLQLVREFFGHEVVVSRMAEPALHRGFLLRRGCASGATS